MFLSLKIEGTDVGNRKKLNNNRKTSAKKFRFVLWVELGIEEVKNEKLEEIKKENNFEMKYKQGRWIICERKLTLNKTQVEKVKIWYYNYCGTSQGAHYYAISFHASRQRTQATARVTHKNMLICLCSVLTFVIAYTWLIVVDCSEVNSSCNDGDLVSLL
jgi:hypothetical protein